MKKPQTVYVVNGTGMDFKDRFDGEDIFFPAAKLEAGKLLDPEQAVEISVDAATLIFGFGEESKLRAIQRLGWAATSNDMKGALDRLGQFQFHLEPPGLSTAPQVTASPASEPKGEAGARSDADVAVAGADHVGKRPLLGKLAQAAGA